jgi:hypothetical protein
MPILRAPLLDGNQWHCERTRWNKTEDFLYRAIRQGNITFVSIDANPFACERYGMLDFGAQYAISADGRILRRLTANEPDWTSPHSSPDAGENEDAGYGQKYELRDLDRMNMEPVADPPFFTRPEWLDSENNPWRSMRKPRPPCVPDGGPPDGGCRRWRLASSTPRVSTTATSDFGSSLSKELGVGNSAEDRTSVTTP